MSLQAEQEEAGKAKGVLRKRIVQLELMVVVEKEAASAVEDRLRSKLKTLQNELDGYSQDNDDLLRTVITTRAQQNATGLREQLSSRPSSVPAIALAGSSILSSGSEDSQNGDKGLEYSESQPPRGQDPVGTQAAPLSLTSPCHSPDRQVEHVLPKPNQLAPLTPGCSPQTFSSALEQFVKTDYYSMMPPGASFFRASDMC